MVFIIDDIISTLVMWLEAFRLIFIAIVSLLVFSLMRKPFGEKFEFRNEIAGAVAVAIFTLLWYYLLPLTTFLGLTGLSLVMFYLLGIPIATVFIVIINAIR